MILLALWALLLLGAAVLVASSLRFEGSALLVAVYVVVAAEIVGTTELLSLAHEVRAAGYLAVQAVAAVGAALLWLRRGRPLPALPRPRVPREPLLFALGAAVAAAIGYEAFLAFALPPNNWDALAYHLSRAAAWYQHDAVGWISGAHTDRQNVFPPNAEMEVLSTFAFVHSDRLAALPQFCAELALLPAVYLTAARVGFERRAAVFAALLTLTLTEFALQATTAQNDLVVTALVVSAVALLLGRTRHELTVAAMAVGLAIGTKLTALFILPVVGLLALLLLPRRRLAVFAVTVVAACAAFGAFGYVSNAVHTGSIFGRSAEVASFSTDVTPRDVGANVARDYWRFVDFSGYDPRPGLLDTIWNVGFAAFEGLHLSADPAWPNTAANEDVSYFGPLGLLLVVPLSLLFVIGGAMQRVGRLRIVLALALPVFVLELALVYQYNPFVGRFLLIPVALTMALAACLWRFRLLRATFALAGVASLAAALAFNHAKPAGLDGVVPAWQLARSDVQSTTRVGMRGALEWIAANVPPDARVGVRLGTDDWDYPLYGTGLARTLVPLRAGAGPPPADLRWIVVSGRHPQIPAGWRTVSFPSARWTVLYR